MLLDRFTDLLEPAENAPRGLCPHLWAECWALATLTAQLLDKLGVLVTEAEVRRAALRAYAEEAEKRIAISLAVAG